MVDEFTPAQLRVLGSLAEKEATVPDTYPMTLNGLQSACNQKNNREPVTDLDTFTVQRTLDELKAAGYVRFVFPSHGARSTKYRHVLDEKLRLDPAELALLTVLVLRGPQTLNELRTRTERAHAFADSEVVEATLEDLAARDEPLVVHLARRPGQKETRWMHLLGGPFDETAFDDTAFDVEAASTDRAGGAAGRQDRIGELEERLAAVEAQLRSVLDELGMSPSSGND